MTIAPNSTNCPEKAALSGVGVVIIIGVTWA